MEDGLDAGYVGTAEDGTVGIVGLWESKADAERFCADKSVELNL